MEKTLDEVKPGESGTVARVNGAGEVMRRMMDMGLTPGAAIKVVKVAPLGDPIEITVRGYQLSVRKMDAQYITVEVS